MKLNVQLRSKNFYKFSSESIIPTPSRYYKKRRRRKRKWKQKLPVSFFAYSNRILQIPKDFPYLVCKNLEGE